MKAVLCFIWISMVAISPSAFAAECPSGSDGHLCRAEKGDAHAMFKVARAAYLEGRETGDFSPAYKWAWESKKLGDRWGRQILKMIYINSNLHHDPIEAHRWLTRAIGEGKRNEYDILWKQRLEALMTREQIEEANSHTLD